MSIQSKPSRPFAVDFVFYLVATYLAVIFVLALLGVVTWAQLGRDLGLVFGGALVAGAIAGLVDTVRTALARRRVGRAVAKRIEEIERGKMEPRPVPPVPIDAPYVGGPF